MEMEKSGMTRVHYVTSANHSYEVGKRVSSVCVGIHVRELSLSPSLPPSLSLPLSLSPLPYERLNHSGLYANEHFIRVPMHINIKVSGAENGDLSKQIVPMEAVDLPT